MGHLTQFDTWIAFNSAVMKILEYPLLALALIDAECNTIMTSVPSADLPNMKICRSMARATLVYGPITNQRLGINKIFATYGYSPC